MAGVPTITLKCPKCGRKKRVLRQADDPAAATMVHIQCPKCNPGDFDSPAYFDPEGRQLDWETGQPF